MSRNRFFEGVREIGRDPALLLIEIGWRWSFGAIAICAFCFSALLIMDRIPVDSRSLQFMAALNPLQLAQKIAEGIASTAGVLLRVALSVGLLVTAIWVLFSALGRYATCTRAALKPGAPLHVCVAVSVLRAVLTWGCIAAWFMAGLFAGLVGSSKSQDSQANFGLMFAILFLAVLLVGSLWSTLNWILSLVPLSPEPSLREGFVRILSFIRSRRDEFLEISVLNGIFRLGVFVVALLFSVAASSVITNARILLAELLAISLLYLLFADFLYMARLIAFGKLRAQPVTEQHSIVYSRSGTATITANS